MAEGKPNIQRVGDWSSQVYKLSDFLERFQLPQIVKVHEGYHDENEEKTIGVDDILILHKYETIPKVFAISFQGGEEWGEVSLPLTCAVKVDRVCEEFAKSRLSCGGILQQLSKVRFVRVTESDTEVGLGRNDKLKVKYKTVENHGSSFSFILSTLTKPKRVFRVTQNCKATFQAVLDANEYRIAEVVRKFGLPNYVYMVDNIIQGKLKNSSQPIQKVLELQRTFTETFVVASTLEDSSSVIKLPKNLEVTLRSSVEAENQRQTGGKLCKGQSSNRIEKEERTIITERADSSVVYEDMSSEHAKETEIASLQKANQMTREIKQDASGKLQVVIPNNYTPTPLVRPLSNRNDNYDFPKTTLTERTQESSKSQKTLLYDTPRGGLTSTQNDERSIFESLFKNQIYSQEYARMEWLKSSSISPSAEDEESDHIYQEIAFRELPGEMSSSGKEALKNTNRIIPSIKQKIPLRRDSAPANRIVGESKTELGQHSNTYQIDRKMTDKSKTARKYRPRNVQTDSDHAVYENCNFLKARLSECDLDYEVQEEKTSPQRRATSAGVVSLKSSLGSVISDALLKNKLSAMKADGTVMAVSKIPPQPPPRTSSRKPGIPEEPECSATGNDGITIRKKDPLPEPPKPNVRRSASAAATFGIFKDKRKFYNRPLPNPKIGSQSLDPTDVPTEKGPSTETQGSTSRASSEKPLRPKFKPLVPPKATAAPSKPRLDGNEGKERDPRQETSNSFDLRKPASLPRKPKAYASSHTKNKYGNELMEVEERTNLSPRANRSHSMNELDTKCNDTKFIIPDDLRSLGVAGVAECLRQLKMEQLVEYFKENQIDGDMLASLDDDILDEMGVEKFHRLKLVKFIGGWRPML